MSIANIPPEYLDSIIEGFPRLFGSKDVWEALVVGFQYGQVSVFEHMGDDGKYRPGGAIL